MTCLVCKAISVRAVATVLAALMVAAVQSSASTTIGIIDWDTNPPDTAWEDFPDVPAVDVLVNDDLADYWLEVVVDGPLAVLVRGSAADLFAGTWSSESWIEFDFWSDGGPVPESLEVRWANTGDTNVWGYVITPASGSGWQSLRTESFGNGAAWNIGLGDPGDFLDDLSSIDWIGIYIEQSEAGNRRYGIDDFSLMVPEPAEILMLAASLGVGLLVFRRMRLVPS